MIKFWSTIVSEKKETRKSSDLFSLTVAIKVHSLHSLFSFFVHQRNHQRRRQFQCQKIDFSILTTIQIQ